MAQRALGNVDGDETTLESHFAFGENWADFAQLIDEDRLRAATDGLLRLLAGRDLKNKRFLDIGCGSGLHSLAALTLGASEVFAIDLDPRSVDTTRSLLARHAPDSRYRVDEVSVFDLEPNQVGQFDVVYSWGVLHHTGDMLNAIRRAAAMVKNDGSFLVALYRRTWLCGFWKVEKRWYSRASERAQSWASRLYTALFAMGLWATGRTLRGYDAECAKKARGMNVKHDTHDWLGGYPYESISSGDVDALMRELGFTPCKSFVREGLISRVGIFGSGCDEYHYRRLKP